MTKKVPKKLTELTLKAIQNALMQVINPKFDSINKNFESIDKRFNSVDKRFDSVDLKFKSVDQKFNSMDKKVESVDKKFGIFELRIVLAFNRKMDEIKDYMVGQRSDIATMKDEIMGELKTIRKEQTILNGRSAKINKVEDQVEELIKIHPHSQHIAS